MGGGDDTPDAPDYAPVIESIKKGLGFTQKQAEETLAFARDAYKQNKGVSDTFIMSALGQMDKLSADADQARADYQQYRPVAAQQVKEALRLSSPEEQERAAGAAEQDVALKIKAEQEAARERLEGYGVDPSQTRSAMTGLATAVGGAGMSAAAGNKARLDQQAAGREAVALALNQGNTTAARINPTAAASLGAGAAAVNSGLQTEAQRVASMGSPTQWSALTGQGNESWARTLGQGFENEMDKFKADQESSSGWGQLAGTILPLATKYFLPGMEEGGVIPDPTQMFADGGGPIPPELSPSGGAIPDDIPAVIDGQQPAALNAGEFVVPQDVMKWMGEKGMQQIILKARKEMAGGNGERPAQPEMAEGPSPGPGYESTGAIPSPPGAVA